MRDFRRAVFRLLAMTAILLFGAWAALKVMQYRGDIQAVVRDLRNTGLVRFMEGRVVPFFRDQLWAWLQALTAPLRELVEARFN